VECVGIKQKGVGGLGIDAKEGEKVQIIFEKLFGTFLDGGGRTSPRRRNFLG
jgi:hypothetical protein